MTDIVKGMEKARHDAYWSSTASAGMTMEEEAMRAALMWLSEHFQSEGKDYIAAAIRAAAGGQE